MGESGWDQKRIALCAIEEDRWVMVWVEQNQGQKRSVVKAITAEYVEAEKRVQFSGMIEVAKGGNANDITNTACSIVNKDLKSYVVAYQKSGILTAHVFDSTANQIGNTIRLTRRSYNKFSIVNTD